MRNYGKHFAEGGLVGDDYNTPLSAAEEKRFQNWKKKTSPDDSGADYDLRGAYKDRMKRDSVGHMGDKYKKPNHPTFSDESKYATGAERDRAGHWVEGEFIPPAIK
jgi:hypothetical protein